MPLARCPKNTPGVGASRVDFERHPHRFVLLAGTLLAFVGWSVVATAAPNAVAPTESPKPVVPSVTASTPTAPSQIQDALVVSLQDALRLAMARAPELALAAAEREGSSEFTKAANRSLHRPPAVEISMGPRRPSSGGNLGVDTTVGVYQEFSVGGYGKQLSKYADAATARADANIELAQRDALVRAYLAWLDALQARELLKLRIEALEEIREVSRIAEARLAAGRSSPGEAALAKALVGSAEASVLSARGSITQADAYLRYVCGIELHRPLEISGVLDAPPLDIDEQSIRAKVLRVAPDLKSARAEANTLSQSAILGRAGSKPFLQLGPSITREGTGDWVFLGHVRMPLPGVDPAAAENAERKLSAHIAKAKVTVLEQAVLRDVEVALHEREHALKTRDLLLHESIEPSKLAAHEARLQYEAGRSDLVSVITSRRELYDALEKWIRAAIDVQRADARLERYMDLSSQKKGQR